MRLDAHSLLYSGAVQHRRPPRIGMKTERGELHGGLVIAVGIPVARGIL